MSFQGKLFLRDGSFHECHLRNNVQEWTHVRRLLGVGEKTPRNESCDFSFFKNTKWSPDSAFTPLPGVADRREFTSDYSTGYWYLFICLYGKTCFCREQLAHHVWFTCHKWLNHRVVFPPCVACPYGCTLSACDFSNRVWTALGSEYNWILYETWVHLIYGLHSSRSYHL